MNDFFKNPYFYPKEEKAVEAEIVTEPEVQAIEEVKGLTSIIIPAYFLDYAVFHYTGNCIGSIREHTDKEKTPYEIILIINGKTHISLPNLEASYCDKVIENEENKGYGYAVNQGIRIAKGEYIAVVNNDVQTFNHWLEEMIVALDSLDFVMATPMYGMPFARAVEAEELRQKAYGEQFSDFRDFSCICTRKSLFAEIGTFNEDFFAYKEDLDLFNRMDKAGKKYASTKRVNVTHIIGATSSNMTPEQLHKAEGEEVYKKLWQSDSQL